MKKAIYFSLFISLFSFNSFAASSLNVCEDCFLEEQPQVDTSCMDITNKVQSLEFHIKLLSDQMSNLCDITAMNDCSSADEKSILTRYKNDIGNLKRDVKKMMVDAIGRGCTKK